MIRRELLHTKRHADAPIFMLSEEAVQDEVVQCLAKAAATSVDVERKHHQDKHLEKKNEGGHRQWRAAHVQQSLTNDADIKRKLYMKRERSGHLRKT